ncbi:MAM and LDL-receptor class A domain-containing protein 1-like [Branchiostoma floridae x Branchiostoma belcheri]
MTDNCRGVGRELSWVHVWLILTWAAVFVGPQVPFASNCNFDGGAGDLLCGFVQQTVGDDFDWEIGSGPVESLGLSGDHTGGGSYAYFDTTGKTPSQTAILRSMQLASAINHCLTFYYYMAGTGVGSLAVLQRQVGEQRRTELWSVEGDQGREWRQARVDITSPVDAGGTQIGYRINFDAVVGSGQPGLIAIDDVVFINGPCDSDGCNVPLGMESRWITDDQITASPSGQDYPPRNARLHGNGCWIPSTPQSAWLQVEFPTTMILTGIRTQGFRTGWITKYKVEYSETLSSTWIICNAFITTDQLTGNVDADSVVEHLFSGRLQAQRIRVIPIQYHMQPSLRLEIIGCDYGSCTFDVSPCGYIRNYSIADFMWTWKTATGSEFFSPTSDHTSGAGGSFLLADATGRQVDDTAILSTEVQPPTPAKCVAFFYYMDGPDVGALNVYLKRDDMSLAEAVAMTPAWRLVGQQGAGWRRGGIEITADFPYEVVFQAVIGDGGVFGYGDIGLDDVSVREGLCPYPEFDECLSSPCLNNGTCTDGKDNYTCTCGEQFYGPNCEHDMDDCKSAPCLNDGTCIDGDKNYTCICSDAFYGSHCEFGMFFHILVNG